jgi:hypothetical protein
VKLSDLSERKVSKLFTIALGKLHTALGDNHVEQVASSFGFSRSLTLKVCRYNFTWHVLPYCEFDWYSQFAEKCPCPS